MLPPEREPSSELLRALERLVRVLNERTTDYALIGGLGVAVRSAPADYCFLLSSGSQ